jgi:hypothetical protein
MWMTQLGHRASFAQKAVGYVSIADKFSFDDLDCDWTFKAQMSGAIDRTHAPGADFTLDSKSTGYELRDIHT